MLLRGHTHIDFILQITYCVKMRVETGYDAGALFPLYFIADYS